MRRVVATALVAVLVFVVGAAGSMSTARSSVHTVRRGETLASIADRYGTTIRALARANGIGNPDLIVAGAKLSVPAAAGGGTRTGVPAKLAAHPDRLALRPRLLRWAAYYGVPADLLEGLTWVESGWQRDIVSSAGAVGIGQLMPATVALTWNLIGQPLDPFNADDNIRMTSRFLRYLLDATGGRVTTALAAYYQGLRSVRTGPIKAETLIYVATVLAARSSFR